MSDDFDSIVEQFRKGIRKEEEENKEAKKKVKSVRRDTARHSRPGYGNVLLAAVIAILAVVFFAGTAGIILLIIAMLAAGAGIYSIYTYFAPRNLFFTGVKEGTAKMVMVGTKEDPRFVRAIMNYRNHCFNEEWDVIDIEKDGYSECSSSDIRSSGSILESVFKGLYFIGFPGVNWIYEYDFKWISKTAEGAKLKKKTIDYIYLKDDIYLTKLEKAEVGKSMVPVDIELLLTIRITNPYKALFGVEEWLEFAINKLGVPIRGYVSNKDTPFDLIKEKSDGDSLGRMFLKKAKESGTLKDLRNVGIEVLSIETSDIDLGEDWQKIASSAWVAEKEAEARVKKGEAEGKERAAQIKDLVEKYGMSPEEAARHLRQIVKYERGVTISEINIGGDGSEKDKEQAKRAAMFKEIVSDEKGGK